MAGYVNRANAALGNGATRLGAKAASAKGPLAGLGRIAAKGLGWFAKLGPWGKGLTLAAGVLGLNRLVRGHPAARRI